jgi:thiol-disulfide isomerase/thioredoxin
MNSILTRSLRALLATALVVLPVAIHAQTKGLKIGDAAPMPVIASLDGIPTNLAAVIAGRPAVIEFWATWCPLCRSMEPTFKAMAATYGDKLAIVRIVVPTNQTPERAKAAVEKGMLPGTFLFDTDGAAYKAFAAYHTSYILVLDRKGKVLYSQDGGTQDLSAVIKQAVE